ncbi:MULTISPECIES: diiron oxygenase [Photorhabdus]|uniref:diiron oxygenase n=1 Tax=Photorhabdus TaxID=29487 RepID=UPI0021D49084|nr:MULTISPECIES: diiron oxygenase [Photorhabdus]MCT8352842.1 diiron oxygenase [Photorhabdus kayaii]MDB6369655.1 diiron oxygenase [Photorhabdus bodei]
MLCLFRIRYRNRTLLSKDYSMSLIETTLKKWDRSAIVRSRPRRLLNEQDHHSTLFFPLERLPLCTHPQVDILGDEALRYIQVQMLYHYLSGIANIELDIINDSSYKLYKNVVGVYFPTEMRLDALTVVVDESYHALVALDLINQVEQMTGVVPLPMPKDTEASYALAMALEQSSDQLRELLRLVCVSLSEQALTTDLIDVINNEDIFPSFYLVMKDHVADEGRHARFFQQVLGHIWCHSDSKMKQAMKTPIITFIESYTTDVIAKDFGTQILRH